MTPVDSVIARLVGQGCRRVDDTDVLPILKFEAQDGSYFAIPVPPDDNGYSDDHLREMEILVQAFGLDLLPIDMNHVA